MLIKNESPTICGTGGERVNAAPQKLTQFKKGHVAMVIIAVRNPAWCRIFREISCFYPLNIGTLF